MHDQTAKPSARNIFCLGRGALDHLAPLATLARGQVVETLLAVDGLGSLLNNLLTLGQYELDVGWVGHYQPVSTRYEQHSPRRIDLL